MTPAKLFTTIIVYVILVTGVDCMLDFISSPKEVQPLLTKELTIACRLENFNITTDLYVVNSVLIMRENNEAIASLTGGNKPIAIVDSPNIKVNGKISTSPLMAFLNITWNKPTESEGGNFICEMNGLTKIGHMISYTAGLEIKVKNPDVSDLVGFIHQNQVQIESLKKELTEAQHIESGQVNCGESGHWSSKSPVNMPDKHISFSKTYKNIPKVIITVRVYHSRATVGHSGFDVYPINVTKDGFDCPCYNFGGMANLEYNWLSVPFM